MGWEKLKKVYSILLNLFLIVALGNLLFHLFNGGLTLGDLFLLSVLTFILYCIYKICLFFFNCLRQVWYVYFSKGYELETEIKQKVEKTTGQVCDVVLKDKKVNITLYEKKKTSNV